MANRADARSRQAPAPGAGPPPGVGHGDDLHGGSSLQPGGGAALSDEEFEVLLNELAAGPALPHLPAGFARADIDSDHD